MSTALKGKVELEYYDDEDLTALLELLEQAPAAGKGGPTVESGTGKRERSHLQHEAEHAKPHKKYPSWDIWPSCLPPPFFFCC